MTRTHRVLLTMGVLVAVAQVVPLPAHPGNPPVRQEPQWDKPETGALVRRACYDCHSNETKWPWYSQIVPAKWLVRHHVDEGRHELNFSEFDKPQKHAKDAAEMVREGEMPMPGYVLLHAEAKLSEAEKTALIAGLAATFGNGDDAASVEKPAH